MKVTVKMGLKTVFFYIYFISTISLTKWQLQPDIGRGQWRRHGGGGGGREGQLPPPPYDFEGGKGEERKRRKGRRKKRRGKEKKKKKKGKKERKKENKQTKNPVMAFCVQDNVVFIHEFSKILPIGWIPARSLRSLALTHC